MKFLSTWLRNDAHDGMVRFQATVLNEVPEHMAQEYAHTCRNAPDYGILNEVPEHMAQELVGMFADTDEWEPPQ